MSTAARDIDALVAEKVMGWQRREEHPGFWWLKHTDRWACVAEVFFPSTNAKYDYMVLVHVRETWDTERQVAFAQELSAVLYARARNQPVGRIPYHYQPGDYSRAALAVVEQGE